MRAETVAEEQERRVGGAGGSCQSLCEREADVHYKASVFLIVVSN